MDALAKFVESLVHHLILTFEQRQTLSTRAHARVELCETAIHHLIAILY